MKKKHFKWKTTAQNHEAVCRLVKDVYLPCTTLSFKGETLRIVTLNTTLPKGAQNGFVEFEVYYTNAAVEDAGASLEALIEKIEAQAAAA